MHFSAATDTRAAAIDYRKITQFESAGQPGVIPGLTAGSGVPDSIAKFVRVFLIQTKLVAQLAEQLTNQMVLRILLACEPDDHCYLTSGLWVQIPSSFILRCLAGRQSGLSSL
jgi:hypothetical protein